MGTMYVVKRVLGSITSVLKGPGSAGPLEVENSGAVPVNVYFQTTNPGDTQVAAASPMPVTAASLPLPTGAATSALQGGGMPAALAAGGGLKVEGVAGGVAQPVSGTFWQATQPVSGTVTANQGAAGATGWPTTDAGPSQALVQKYSTSADMSTPLEIVAAAPAAGNVHVFVDLIIGVGTACVMTIQDEDDVVLLAMPMDANDKFFGTTRGYIQTVGVAKKTEVKTSVASTGYVWAKYYSVVP